MKSICLFVFGIVFYPVWPAPAAAQSIRVLLLDESRTGPDINLLTGPSISSVRDALLDPARFGPDGTVAMSVTLLPPVPQALPVNLSNADVVLWPMGNTNSLPSAAEISALSSFVQSGGGLFVFGNFVTAFASMVGAVPGGNGLVGNQAVVTDEASPLATGRFGALGVGTTFRTGFQSWLADAGSTGTVGLRSANGVVGATFSLGIGSVALVGDEEIFLSSPVPANGGDALLSPTTLALFLNAFAHVASRVPSFTIDWSTVDGGGGASTGGGFTVVGTVGQPDAGVMTGSGFALAGGYWSLFSTPQPLPLPHLRIDRAGSNVVLSWPRSIPGYALEYTPQLGAGAWTTEPATIVDTTSEHSVTVPAFPGRRFYRLKR